MVATPGAIAFTIPVAIPIVATVGALLNQLPPLTASLRVELLPTHNDVIPVIVDPLPPVTETIVVALAVPHELDTE